MAMQETPVTAFYWKDGQILAKLDNEFEIAGIRGGKVRGCWHLATHTLTGEKRATPPAGLITASARKSPQMQIVARLAAKLGIPARLHMPMGQFTPEMADAVAHGGEIIQHKAGYNSVICARAREDYETRKADGWVHIPFGMEDMRAMACTRQQVVNLNRLAHQIKRVVIPVGSGMSMAGVMHGLQDQGIKVPVLGVVIGADPVKRLNKYAPTFWHTWAKLVPAGLPYDHAVEAKLGDMPLDPIYEAKCLRFLEPGDLFWIVGIRTT